MKLSILFILLQFVLLQGCTHSLHLSHQSDFGPSFKAYAQGEWVKSKAEQFVVMGFVSDTNYVDIAYNRLQDECPKGQIQGIQTQYSTSHGFFSWTNVIQMQGLCVK